MRNRWRIVWTLGTFALAILTVRVSAMPAAPDDSGTIVIVLNGEAQITWDDGWRDAIRKVGTKFQKVAHSPGTTFSDKPNNVADAEKHAEPN